MNANILACYDDEEQDDTNGNAMNKNSSEMTTVFRTFLPGAFDVIRKT